MCGSSSAPGGDPAFSWLVLALGMFLDPCSGVMPDGAQGPGDARNQTQASCTQTIYLGPESSSGATSCQGYGSFR